MDFSITFASYPDCWKEAQLAEEHGFANAWFYDTQLHYSDVYACMALAADRTSRIRLGTQVSIPSLRIAPTTATAIATINALAPGRVVLGIGVGGFSVRRSMGLKPLRVAGVKEYVRQVRGLLAGEDVLYREGKEERWIRLLHPDQGYLNLQDRIPIYIAANGPKMLEATGELGEERFLTEEMVLSTMTGGAGEIIERVRAWEAAGVSDVGLQVMGDTGREMIEEFSREVIAKY